MTTIQLYRKHKAGEVSRDKFLYEVRRDQNLPWVTNITSYDDAVKILKNKGIISEAEINELSPQTKYNAAMKAVDKRWASNNSSDSNRIKSIRQGNKFVQHIDPILKKTVEDFGKSLGLETSIEKGSDGYKFEPVIQILMGKDLRAPEVKITIRKDSDEIEGRLPDEAAERRLGNLIKQIQKKELDVELKSDSLNEADANIATDPAVDKVNPYFLKKGVEKILAKEKELTNDSYINALNKAAKQLEANPHAFDEDMFANAKEVEKADSKLETEEVKKNNFVNKDRQMKKAKGHNIEKANTKVSTKENKKGKPKGVQMMKESVLQDLLNFLKKKELINEDSHWKHTVGSEVHTPDGPGKIVEIMGSTLTIEMEDGTHKDYQINVVDNATEKAMEEQSSEEPKAEPSKDDVKDMWAKWDKERGIDLGKYVVDPGYHSELDKKYGKLKEYIAKHKDDKEKMNKLKNKLKELIDKTKIMAAKQSGTIVNVPNSAKADITNLQTQKVPYSTYQG